jgi:hypothetical protein
MKVQIYEMMVQRKHVAIELEIFETRYKVEYYTLNYEVYLFV